MTELVLALGSNLGDSATILQGAVDALATVEGIELTAVSTVVETDPVGGPDQPAYLNAVVVGQTSLAPHDLLARVHEVEQAFHRERRQHWGPRTLDIDILALGDVVLDDEDLVVPHPRAHERAFVLVPWQDVDPAAVIPGHGAVGDLLAAVGTDGVRATDYSLTLGAA